MKVVIVRGPRFEKTKEHWNKKITNTLSKKSLENLVVEGNSKAVS